MDIGLNIFTRYGGAKYRLANALLAACAAVLVVALVRALWQPVYVQDGTGKKTVQAAKPDDGWTPPSRSAYGVIVEKDLFRPSRQKYVVLLKPAPKSFAAQPPAPKPPPKLTLIGTVIRTDGETAIIDYPGGEQKSSYYKVGDEIEGFVVKEIGKDSVLLERGAEILKVVMRQSLPSWSPVPAATVVTPAAPRLRPPAATPPEFPQTPPAR